jgi:hypothetical protein
MLLLVLALAQSAQQDSICTPVNPPAAAAPAPLRPARKRVFRPAAMAGAASKPGAPVALGAAKSRSKRKPNPVVAARTKPLSKPGRLCQPMDVALAVGAMPAADPAGPPLPVDPALNLRPMPPSVTEEMADPAPVAAGAPAAESPGAVSSAPGKGRSGLFGLGAAIGSGLFLAFLSGHGGGSDALTPEVPSNPPPEGPGPGPGGNPPPIIPPPVSATPEPATLLLVGSGLVGAGLAARRRRKQRGE